MKNMINIPPYFVIRVDKNTNAVETIVVGPDLEKAEELAKSGVGCVNYVVGTVDTIDRLTPPPAEIAEEAIKFLQDVIKGRRHSSSPQCLPTAQYRRLAELAEQYARAVENQKED